MMPLLQRRSLATFDRCVTGSITIRSMATLTIFHAQVEREKQHQRTMRKSCKKRSEPSLLHPDESSASSVSMSPLVRSIEDSSNMVYSDASLDTRKNSVR